MKIQLLCVGSVAGRETGALIDRYAARVTRYMPFEIVTCADVRTSRATTPADQSRREGEILLSKVGSSDCLILFDEHGREMSSRTFADFIARKAVTLPRNLIFAIGGPYGFSSDVRARADGMISLSQMTLPHDLVRIFAVEQIYRAMTIMRGEPYHHD